MVRDLRESVEVVLVPMAARGRGGEARGACEIGQKLGREEEGLGRLFSSIILTRMDRLWAHRKNRGGERNT